MPEISLFRDMRHSGRTELQVYTIDADSGKFLNKSRVAVGAAQYDDYKILLVINFTRSDIEKGSWQWHPGPARLRWRPPGYFFSTNATHSRSKSRIIDCGT